MYVLVYLKDYGMWMDLRQAALYQIDSASTGGSVILRANQIGCPGTIFRNDEAGRFSQISTDNNTC
jgi:hypothetical protein